MADDDLPVEVDRYAKPPPPKLNIIQKFVRAYKSGRKEPLQAATKTYEKGVAILPKTEESREDIERGRQQLEAQYRANVITHAQTKAQRELEARTKYGAFPRISSGVARVSKRIGSGYQEFMVGIQKPASRYSGRLGASISGGFIRPAEPEKGLRYHKSKEVIDAFAIKMINKYSKKYDGVTTFADALPYLSTRERLQYINLRNRLGAEAEASSRGGFLSGQGMGEQIISGTAIGSRNVAIPQVNISQERLRGFSSGMSGSNINTMVGFNVAGKLPQTQTNFTDKISGLLSINTPRGANGNKIKELIGMK